MTTHFASLCIAIAVTGTTFAYLFPQQEGPGAGATVRSPTQVNLTFNGPWEPSFSSIFETDAAGTRVSMTSASVGPQSPSRNFARLPALTAGRYVAHQVAAPVDAHRAHGDYALSVR